MPGEQDFCLLPWPQEGTGSKSPMGVEGRNLDPHISAEATLAQLTLVAPTQLLLPGLPGPAHVAVSAMRRHFQVQSVLPQVILALKDSSAAGAGV